MGIYWRSGNNDYGSEIGIDSTGFETFKKDPMSSFAREIVQNSIDARRKDKTKVKIEFSVFDLATKDIPDVNTLISGLHMVRKNWQNKKNTKENDLNRMNEMADLIKSKSIRCMRVSDFNTTGLIGISKLSNDYSPYYSLLKGEGMSFKEATSGGSKGIGKYAAFVVSKLRTIFYSTNTIDNECGHIGTAKLPSGYYIHDNGDIDEKLKTNGEWYYAREKYNYPIDNEISLDKNYSRKTGETGTDIFILAFDEIDNWQETMIVKILDSFLIAIYKEELEIVIDDIILNKDTLSEIINNLTISKYSVDYKSIKAQYDLISSDDIQPDIFMLGNYGEVQLYVKTYSHEDSNLATKQCTMIRYPYMKIKNIPRISNLPFSAMAVIGNNKINEILRKFENPEHTNWFFKRNDLPEELKKEASQLYNELITKIKEKITNALYSSDEDEIDVHGASEFLPSIDDGNIGGGKHKEVVEKIIIHKRRFKSNQDEDGKKTNKYSLSTEVEEIDMVEEGEHELMRFGEGKRKNGEQATSPSDDKEDKKFPNKKLLMGVRYNLVATDPQKGAYEIRFIHDENLSNCVLQISIVGDSVTSNEKHELNILDAKIDDKTLKVSGNSIYYFDVLKNNITTIKINTDQVNLFSGRVRLLC